MTHALTPGVTSIPRQLLKHWFDRGEWSSEEKRWIGEPRQYPFCFRQLEAIEALIWWPEAPPDFKQDIFKGVDNEQNRAKRAAMETWIKSVNEQGGFGHWCFATVFAPANIRDVMLTSAQQASLHNSKSCTQVRLITLLCLYASLAAMRPITVSI